MRFLIDGFFAALHWFDDHIIDGAVNGIAGGTLAVGTVVRKLETGQLQAYGLAIIIGILVIVAFVFIFN